jgi:Zn-dependent protease with chaperone function
MIVTTDAPNHPLELVRLVDQLADTAGVTRPAVVIVPFTSGNPDQVATAAPFIDLAFQPGRTARHARLDVSRAVLAQFSPTALRYLLAHEIAHLRLHRRGIPFLIDRALNAAGWITPVATLLVLLFGHPSLAVLATGFVIALVAELARQACFLATELHADRYAATTLADIDHQTIDELWDYNRLQSDLAMVSWIRQRILHHLVEKLHRDRAGERRSAVEISPATRGSGGDL